MIVEFFKYMFNILAFIMLLVFVAFISCLSFIFYSREATAERVLKVFVGGFYLIFKMDKTDMKFYVDQELGDFS